MAKFCPECGAAAEGARFCPGCGTALNGETTVSAATFRLRVPKDSTLRWTNDGDYFSVFDLEGFEWVGISSEAHRGDSFIPAGRYQLTVNAIGNWTITIR